MFINKAIQTKTVKAIFYADIILFSLSIMDQLTFQVPIATKGV